MIYGIFNDPMFLHTDDAAAVDWDWTVVIVELNVEVTSVDDMIVAVEGTSVDDIVAALLGVDVAVNVIGEVVVVDYFDVVGDVAVNVISAGGSDNVVAVVAVVVVDGVVWVVEGNRSPLQLRLSTILELPTVILIQFIIISDKSY